MSNTQSRALVVDDDEAVCGQIQKALAGIGIDSICMTNSSEAAGLLHLSKFGVAFLDYGMAWPDGPALTRLMRESRFNRMTPIILVSDDQRPRAMCNAFEAGASFFFYKPIDRDRLIRLIRATHGAIAHEHRRTRRVPLKSKVELQFRDQKIEAETLDVSMDGLLIKAPRTLPVGSSIDVRLFLHQAAPIIGSGSVVRCHGKDEMGIHLGQLNIAESQRLQDFLLPYIPANPSVTYAKHAE